jgi:hypothetical protein
MKQTWLFGALAGVMLAASAAAQTQPATGTQKPTTGAQQPPTGTQKPPAPPTEKQKPAPEKPAAPTTEKPTTPATGTTQRTTPAARAEVPTGETALGTVSIPRNVMADGKPLPAGRYTVRLTAQTAQPTVPGQVPDLNRWVEFVQGGTVRGREVVSIVPAAEVKDTQPGPDMPGHVSTNQTRVEMLKGGEYLRVWINRGGNNYLVHLPPAGAAAR